MALPKPVSRADMYLSYLNYTKGLTLANLPKPVSRADMYLYNLCINRGIGGGSGGSNVTLNGEPQTNFNFIGDKGNAIKELHATDSTGKTSILKIASDSHHVEMDTGRTLQEELDTYRAIMGKEFVSTDGSAIEVNNAIPSKVLNAEIKGQTVKQLLPSTLTKSDLDILGNNCEILGDGIVKLTATESVKQAYAIKNETIPLRPNTDYTFVFEILENTLDNQAILLDSHGTCSFEAYQLIEAGVTGLYSYKVKSRETLTIERVLNITTTRKATSGYIKLRLTIYEGDVTKTVKGYVPFGLSSTQAIISNNGQSYPIYATEEDKANKKVILLGGVGDVQDTLEIKDDGSVVYTQNLKPVTFDGTENWSLIETRVNTLRFNFPSPQYGVALNTLGILDKIPFGNPRSGDIEGFSCLNNTFTIAIAKTKLVSEDVDGFKKWLSENNQSGLYPISTSIVTPIPKELVPTILTHNQTNILDVGGAVKPSSFKVTVPVDRLAEIEARLQALENTTVDVVLNK